MINDDLIVSGSLCVGFDCVNGENFGFDTIRMKENNTRIKFDDTSSSGSFPNNDWQLTANDSSNGGLNKFSIENTTVGRVPFTIEGPAFSNSLYVDDGGRVGFGTSTPAVQLHSVNGNTPTLRLQQDGSSGFTAQTFDIAANEANFFVRDVTNGRDGVEVQTPISQTLNAQNSVNIGVFPGSSPRVQFHEPSADTLWQIDSLNGQFRWFTPGIVQASLTADGVFTARRGMAVRAGAEPDAPSNGAVLFVDSNGGDLKVKFANGVVKTLATD